LDLQPLRNTHFIDAVFRGKSPKYKEDGNRTILNQKCNRWNNVEIEHVKKVDDNWFNSVDENFKTIENDILINSTGEGTIGRSSIVTKKFENFLCDSHILLLRLKKELINPLFIVYQFNSIFIPKQIEQIKSAQSTKQTELGIDNLLKIKFAIPDLESQTKIVNHINTQKAEIMKLRTQVECLRKQAKTDFEAAIFE
jgi:restriction endonuclease S subunit